MFQLDPDLEAFRQEVRKTAERAFRDKAAHWDEKEEFPEENRALLAKLYANETVQRVTNEALQIHGHAGFAPGGGTTEILRNTITIASIVYGRAFDQRKG
jgi:alkylation response protein AidB-like acyl-CoA dehydrogenase